MTKAGEEQPITGSMKICSDPDDDMFIETAYLGRVDYLVTNDEDLYEPAVLAHLQTVGVKVVRPNSFRAELRRRREQADASQAVPQQPPTGSASPDP